MERRAKGGRVQFERLEKNMSLELMLQRMSAQTEGPLAEKEMIFPVINTQKNEDKRYEDGTSFRVTTMSLIKTHLFEAALNLYC